VVKVVERDVVKVVEREAHKIMKNKILIGFIFLLGTIGIFGYQIYSKMNAVKSISDNNLSSNKKEIAENDSGDTFKDMKNDEDFKNIAANTELTLEQKKQQLLNLSETTNSNFEKETIELYTANLLMQSSKDEGVELYKKIYSDIQNSKVNRAYALLKITQYSRGENKISYILPFLSESELESLKTNAQKYNAIDNKIYELYPFAIAAARIGKYEISQSNSKENAEKIYRLYRENLEKGSVEMLKYEGLRHLAGNTNLNHAQLWAEMEKFKITDTKETQKIFENAFENAKLYSPRGTLQFIVLAYAEYHAERKNYAKVEKLIEFLTNEEIDKNVLSTLKYAKTTKVYPNIQIWYRSASKFKNFFSQFNW